MLINNSVIFKTICFFSIMTFNNILSQELKVIVKLPLLINETSGIEAADNSSFWTFNDHGGNNEIYQLDTIGNMLRTLKIHNAWNRDWEDMSKDDKGNLYIGNIGNNDNDTKDLTIFKITNPNKTKSNSTSAMIISYFYEDQESFPPSTDKRNYDCEAMFWFKNNIYLFTKHRSFPMATNLYRIPAKAGRHKAKKIDTFKTGKKSEKSKDYGKYWITSAAISPDGKTMCLLNENKLWVFYEFKNDQFFEGNYTKIKLEDRTQKEAVCFVTNDLLFITDEYSSNGKKGGNLYKININSISNK